MFFIAFLFAITVKADVPRVHADELRAAMEKGEAVAIDVRGTVPWEIEHIKDAVWMPLGLMKERAGELPEDKLLVTYCTCKAEETSLEGAMLLSSMGFSKVAVLHGGFPAWKNAGLPVASNRTPAPAPEPETVPVEATPVSAGRFAPPAAIPCDRNKLTMYAGTVRDYVRGKNQTSLTIDSSIKGETAPINEQASGSFEAAEENTERVIVKHKGTDDPSRSFLLFGEPFKAADWARIEVKKGELHPEMTAVAWVCEDGSVIVDWRPGTRFTGAE